MLRAEDIICGTSTTGTGTLTLAACPSPPGGVNFYAWLTSTGYNFVNGNAVLVSYIIKEYTDSNFGTVLQSEEGVGTLTLGASLTASTLARTTVQAKQTTESTTGVYAGNAPTAITIGTAANTLIFIGPKAIDIVGCQPYYETVLGDVLGIIPPNCFTGANPSDGVPTTDKDYYIPFTWLNPMLVKKLTIRVASAYTGGTSNVYGRIYDINSSGRPGKLLIDFGVLGTANSSFGATGNISSAVHASGFLLNPGYYFLDLLASFSAGTGTPNYTTGQVSTRNGGGYHKPNIIGTNTLINYDATSATSGTSGAAPDPANTTGYAGLAQNVCMAPLFTLAPS